MKRPRKRPSKRKLPWGDTLGRKPIERVMRPSREPGRETENQWIEEMAFMEQLEKARRLMKHYDIKFENGWRPWMNW